MQVSILFWVFDVLHQLSSVADQAIRDTCRLVLSLIPTDPAIACHLRPKAMAGLLIPMNASERTMSMANRLMSALVDAYLFDHIRAIIAQPYVVPSISPSDRTKIFELCITVLRHLKELESKHSTVDQRRVDSYYTDLSQLLIQRSYIILDFSADKFIELVTSLRDFVWLMTAGWMKYTTRMFIYKKYAGQENSALSHHNKSVEEGKVWEELCDVPEAESASAAIQSPRVGGMLCFLSKLSTFYFLIFIIALTERDTALVGGALALLMKCVYDRMKSLNSKTDTEEKIHLLTTICHDKLWKCFWTDVLVNSVTPQIRQRAYEAIVNFGRSLKAESSCIVLSMLFSMTDALPYSSGKTSDLVIINYKISFNFLTFMVYINFKSCWKS
uniref:HEAT repeat-containing protein 1 n=1 Tax=Heterorhabditis bacteriophora TaxID=37862 RepID=A0A1I7WJS2_HETBA